MKNTKSFRREPLTDSQLLMTIAICIFLVMYVGAMLIFKGGFLRANQIFDILNDNAPLIIVSCGLTIVMIGGGIDISVGAVTSLVVMACALFLNNGGNVYLSMLLAIGIGLGFGLVQGFLISYLDIQPFIVTLAGMFFARGMTTILSVDPQKVNIDPIHNLFETIHRGVLTNTSIDPHTFDTSTENMTELMREGKMTFFEAMKNMNFRTLLEGKIKIDWLGYTAPNGNRIPASMEYGVVIALLCVVVIFLLLKFHKLGRGFYALGGNQTSALMLGINVKRTRFLSYVICGLLSGISGYVFLLHTGAGNATNAVGMEMNAIAASIIGGTLLSGGVGNVVGTFFGVMILNTIKKIVVTSGLNAPWWQSVTTGGMLCFFIILQSVVIFIRSKVRRSRISKK